jgi:peptidoglycan hydrolase-like protein with peptidoglycan-binding domain
MTSIGAFFDVLYSNRADLEDVVARLGGLDAAMSFAAGAGPDLIRIIATIASHQDPVTAAAQAQLVLAYSQDTEDRVRAFQTAHGLDVDGIVGDQTWGKVEELLVPLHKP